MSAQVYSTRFLLGNPSGAGTATYVVPPGKVAIVSDADVIANASGTEILISTNGYPWWSWFAELASGQSLAAGKWQGRAVLYAGDGLGLTWSGLAGYQVSGWLLTA